MTVERKVAQTESANQRASVPKARGLFRVIEAALVSVAVIAILAQIVDGAFPQLRMAINHGSMGGDFVKFKFLLILSAFALAVVRQYKFPPIGLYAAWLAFIGSLTVVSMVHLVAIDKPLVVTWIEFFDNYSLVILLPLLFSLSETVSVHRAAGLIALFLVPLVALGLAQAITSTPLVRVFSTDGLFMVNSWTMSGHIRAFSLFTSGLRFGYFCALSLAFSLTMTRTAATAVERNCWRGFTVIALLGVATTLTRNAYLFCAAVAFSHYVLPFAKKSGAATVKLLMMVIWVPFLLIAIGAPVLLNLAGGKSLVLDTSSMSIRLSEWEHYTAVWLQTDYSTALFGSGISQMSRYSDPSTGAVVDNVMLGTGLHIGLVGLLSFLMLVWAMWSCLVDRYMHSNGARIGSAVILWAPFLGVGTLNSSQVFFMASFFFLVMLREDEAQ